MTNRGRREARASRQGWLVAPLVVAGTGACGSDSGPDGGASGLEDMDAVPRVELEEGVRIGSVDDPDYGFSRVGSVDVDEEGNLYVYEFADTEIRVYSPDGELLRRFGGEGDGPGESSGLTVTFGVRGDTVWVVDGAHWRLTLFDREGNVRSARRIEEVRAPWHAPGERTRMRPEAVDADGLFVAGPGMRFMGSGEGEPADSVEAPRLRFDGDGEVVDTAGTFVSYQRDLIPELVTVGSSRFVVPRQPGSDPVISRLPDGFIRIDQTVPEAPDAIRITRFDHQGDTVRSRLLRYEPKGHPEEFLNARATRRAQSLGGMVPTSSGYEQIQAEPEDTAAAREEILGIIEEEFPEHQRPVQGTRRAADGRLWLRRERTDEDGTRWTVLDAEDRPIGEVVTADGQRLMWVGADAVWIQERDDLDIPWLVRYRLRRP